MRPQTKITRFYLFIYLSFIYKYTYTYILNKVFELLIFWSSTNLIYDSNTMFILTSFVTYFACIVTNLVRTLYRISWVLKTLFVWVDFFWPQERNNWKYYFVLLVTFWESVIKEHWSLWLINNIKQIRSLLLCNDNIKFLSNLSTQNLTLLELFGEECVCWNTKKKCEL